jgi:hypothetical protein
MACTQATKEALCLRRFLGKVGYKQEKPTLIFFDSQGSLASLKKLVHHFHIKHIDIQFHFVKEHIFSNKVEFQYFPTKEMTIDIFMKGIGRDKFKTCRSKLGLIHLKYQLDIIEWEC